MNDLTVTLTLTWAEYMTLRGVLAGAACCYEQRQERDHTGDQFWARQANEVRDVMTFAKARPF